MSFLNVKQQQQTNNITNEMLICSQHVLGRWLVKCFNFCLAHGRYPRSWAKGYILPIHNPGDPTIPSNYKGITKASAVTKVFNLSSVKDFILCPQ